MRGFPSLAQQGLKVMAIVRTVRWDNSGQATDSVMDAPGRDLVACRANSDAGQFRPPRDFALRSSALPRRPAG
jgi:hypothetical protein